MAKHRAEPAGSVGRHGVLLTAAGVCCLIAGVGGAVLVAPPALTTVRGALTASSVAATSSPATASPTATSSAGPADPASTSETAASGVVVASAATAGDAAVSSRLLASTVQPVLEARSAAVLQGQRAAWERVLDPAPSSRSFRAGQLADFDRIRQLPVRRWSYTILSATTAATLTDDDHETVVARVRLGYRLAGDTRDLEREQDVTLVRRDGGWGLAGVRRVSAAADPWELGPLTVVSGRRGLVVGVGDRPRGVPLDRIAQEMDSAAARVDTVWGSGGRRSAVVLVPSTRVQAAALLGRDDGPGLDRVAAVTDGELTRGGPAGGTGSAPGGVADRVVLSPEPFGRLSALGRVVVLTHELTHVTTRAASSATLPLWVDEGFADYVAYRGSGLAGTALAADVLPAARAGTARNHLPAATDFDPAHGDIASAYADAWLAFDLMARAGAGRPLAFYRAAAGLDRGSGTMATAFSTVLGTDERTFEARWRAYRLALAEGRSR